MKLWNLLNNFLRKVPLNLFKKYKPKDELKSKESEKKVTEDHINNEVAISSLNNVELPLQEISNDLNAIINIDQLS